MDPKTIYLTFGFIWLYAGVQEWRIATAHGLLCGYKPKRGAAYYWFTASAVFLVLAAICFWGS